jgi:D-alanyl-lipoteichoic acid acyltransferase DltB (MBOAT superfamily)
MASPLVWGIAFLAYIFAMRLVVRMMVGIWRDASFAWLNLVAFYWFCLYGSGLHFNVAFAVYVILVLVQYVMLRGFAEKPGGLPWLAFFTPIAILVLVRYFPGALTAMFHFLSPRKLNAGSIITLIGISYLAFRNSLLVLEIRNGKVKRPSFWRYLGYSFFVPTMPVGPINPYSNFSRAFETPQPEIPMGRAALRIIVGMVKYQFLGSLCNRLTYDGLLLDEHPHPWMDLPVAMVFYYLFIYCNFSGFCDMAIGAAGLMGVPVAENFDNPFAARNVKDFWNRWHITLSTWMRDVVFSPLSKYLVGKFGIARANHAIALTIVIVFLLVGIWHGVGWNFAAFGAMHALGVVTNHYYTIWLKKRLGREKFKAYNENRPVRACAVALTFIYITASFFLFANTIPEMKEIFSALQR